MPQFGPDDRAVFEARATELYEIVVASGGIKADDPRVTADADSKAAFELLVRLNLLTVEGDDQVWQAVDPATVQSQVVTPMGARGGRAALGVDAVGAGLLGPGAVVAAYLDQRAGPVHRAPRSRRDPRLPGSPASPTPRRSCSPPSRRDCATARRSTPPPGGDLAALERGVKMRSLYQHSARRSSITHKYVAAVTARGAEVRTLDEFFNRIIVIDRRLAVIPGASGPATALLIREPNLLAYLVDIFERTWERSRPFTNRGSAAQRDIAHEQRQMTIRMLIEGHADPASAKRLGVSPRTYAGYIADLKEEFEAETRFQLGYSMGQLGMSGNERADPDDEKRGQNTRAAPVALPSFDETGRGGGLQEPGHGGSAGVPVSSLWSCGHIDTTVSRVSDLRVLAVAVEAARAVPAGVGSARW